MSEPTATRLRREAKTELDKTVVGIELTLISIIQGLALAMLAAAAVQPMLKLQWETWPYIFTGLLVILIFWSRSLIHTLSFIGWPLEFGHTFGYFGATLIEAAALTEVADPQAWFALNACYALAVWGLYAWDLRVVQRQAHDYTTDEEMLLHADIVRDQRENIFLLMPLAVAFQGVSWWLVRHYPDVMLRQRWHLVLIGLTVIFSFNYLYQGVRVLRRRRDWILARQAQERTES